VQAVKQKRSTKMKAFKILENSVVGNVDFYEKTLIIMGWIFFLEK
jgi:hypothetical protein